jgi:hypothetical protein
MLVVRVYMLQLLVNESDMQLTLAVYLCALVLVSGMPVLVTRSNSLNGMVSLDRPH